MEKLAAPRKFLVYADPGRDLQSKFRLRHNGLTDVKCKYLSPEPSCGKLFQHFSIALNRIFSELPLSVKNQKIELCFSEILKKLVIDHDVTNINACANINAF